MKIAIRHKCRVQGFWVLPPTVARFGGFGELLVPVLDQLNLRWWGSRESRVTAAHLPCYGLVFNNTVNRPGTSPTFWVPRGSLYYLIRLTRGHRQQLVQPHKQLGHFFRVIIISRDWRKQSKGCAPCSHPSSSLSTVNQFPLQLSDSPGQLPLEKRYDPSRLPPPPVIPLLLSADPSAGVRVTPSEQQSGTKKLPAVPITHAHHPDFRSLIFL